MAYSDRQRFPFLFVGEASLILSVASSMFLQAFGFRGDNPPLIGLTVALWLAGAGVSIACFIVAICRTNSQPGKILSWFGACAAVAALIFGGPVLVHGHSTSPKNSCINNLRQIDGAKEQFALENKFTAGARVTENEAGQYIKGGFPKCPAGGKYSLGKIDEPPRCSVKGHTL